MLWLKRARLTLIYGPCHGSGGWSPASRRGGPGSIPGRSMWDLWWTKWHWGSFFSPSTSVFPRQFHSTGAALHGKMKTLVIFLIGLHNKPEGCGGSVASAAGPFNKKRTFMYELEKQVCNKFICICLLQPKLSMCSRSRLDKLRAGQVVNKFSSFLWDPHVKCRVHKTLQLECILNQMNKYLNNTTYLMSTAFKYCHPF